MKLRYFFRGCCRLSVANADRLTLLNILLQTKIEYHDFVYSADEKCTLVASHRAAARLRAICEGEGIAAETESLSGLPHIVLFLRRRPGFIIGTLLALLLIYFGSNVLWEVRVTGNERMSDDEVRLLLSGYGVRPGVFISSFDTEEMQARIELDSPDIAWISVNVFGTVAEVNMVEEVHRPAEENDGYDGVNLVAARDGVVVLYEIGAGEPVVTPGNSVREGELLVSGLVDSGRLGWRVRRAHGDVIARTHHTLTVNIPYEYVIKTPVDSDIQTISLIFFSYRIKVFEKCGISEGNCDTINSVWYVWSSPERTMPFGLSFTKNLTYGETPGRRSREEALSLAMFELGRLITAEVGEGRLVRRVTKTTYDDSGVVIECDLTLLENIARPQGFNLVPGNEPDK